MDVTERVQQADARAVVDSVFPKPDFPLDSPCVAPPQTDNYAEIGAAFDYVFTFWLAVNHGAPDIVQWPTEAGLTAIQDAYPAHSDAAVRAVDDAETAFARVVETGVLTDAACQAALDLARVESAYRGHHPNAGSRLARLGDAETGDIADLHRLFETIPDQFAAAESVVVNPSFGPVGLKVGGVTVDAVCDGRLISIKTTQSLSPTVSYWRELIAYATLADTAHRMEASFAGVETTVPELSTVGVYYSRHGVLWERPVSEIYDQPQYGAFREWFLNLT